MADWWQSKQWRLIQTNLREIDMRDIRAKQVVADLQSFHANVLMINAAGIIASYPTRLSFHFQSPYLTGDSLKDILAACHDAGIRVIARTDFSKIRRPIYEQHPDWAYLSPTDQIVDYNGDVHACMNGPYQQECALQIIEELLSTHPFDGIFFNMGGYQTRDYSGTYYGICHCPNCRRLFKEMHNLSLPAKEDMADPVFRTYSHFRHTTTHAHTDKVARFITERWPHVAIANATHTNRGFIRQESNTAIDRALPHWQYSASDNTKWAVGSHPEMVSSNTTVDFIDFPYRHVTVSPDQQALRLAQSLANGGTLDYYLIGRLDNHEDRSGYAPIRDLFAFHAANESHYVDMHSLAEALLLKAGEHQGEYAGWFRILTESHLPFDVMTVDAAHSRPFTSYKAIILPEITAVSDALAARLDEFVAAGGTLIATGQTATKTDRHDPRSAPALRSLGIDQILSVRTDMRSAYLRFTDKSAFPRFADTDLVYLDGPYTFARYSAHSRPSMHLIPPHHFGPPERCYYTQVTDHPGFIVTPFGQGQSIYLPWSPGQLFHRQGHVNTAWFLADLLQSVAGLHPISHNLPPQVEATLFEKADRSYRLLHLVNTTGHFGNTFYPPLPLHNLEITLPSAQPPRPREVRALRAPRANTAIRFTHSDSLLTLHLPRLDLYEALRICS